MWNLKYDANEPIYEAETDSQTQRTDLWLPRWGGGGGWTGSLGQQMQTIIYRMNKQQGPMYSTGNYIQYPVITYYRKESEKEEIYMYY